MAQKPKMYQRRINHYVHEVNLNIKNDSLWRGRFVIRQVESPHFVWYRDGSGGELIVKLCITDNKTDNKAYCYVNNISIELFNGWDIWRFVNDTICEWTMGE